MNSEKAVYPMTYLGDKALIGAHDKKEPPEINDEFWNFVQKCAKNFELKTGRKPTHMNYFPFKSEIEFE